MPLTDRDAIGLYDTVIIRKDAQKAFENIPARER